MAADPAPDDPRDQAPSLGPARRKTGSGKGPGSAAQSARARPDAEGAGQGSKGLETRRRIVRFGLQRAASVGLEGLTIGELASDLGLSKSGLFAHFRSKERLQLAVLDLAAEDFARSVFAKAMTLPRGVPRLRRIMENWLAWLEAPDQAGGCVFLASAWEWDDRPGPVRDSVVAHFQRLLASLQRAVDLCVSEGHLPEGTDAALLASQLHGIAMKYHLDRRLLRDERADAHARAAICRLIEGHP